MLKNALVRNLILIFILKVLLLVGIYYVFFKGYDKAVNSDMVKEHIIDE